MDALQNIYLCFPYFTLWPEKQLIQWQTTMCDGVKVCGNRNLEIFYIWVEPCKKTVDDYIQYMCKDCRGFGPAALVWTVHAEPPQHPESTFVPSFVIANKTQKIPAVGTSVCLLFSWVFLSFLNSDVSICEFEGF